MSELLQGAFTTVLFFVVLGSLVLVHELGHFVTARLAGVRVLEFGIGFPPRAAVIRVAPASDEDVAFAARQRNDALAAARGDPYLTDAILDEEPEKPVGTVYTLNWLPIGGFVKLEGEDGDDDPHPRSFVRARLPTRIVILLAGVFMNLVTALVIFTSIAWLATPLIGIRFGEVQAESPAQAAGLRPGESILAVDGRTYEFFGTEQVLTDLRDATGETVTLTIAGTDGTRRDVSVTLRSQAEVDASEDASGNPQKGPLGITELEPSFYGEYTGRDFPAALSIGVSETGRWFGLILAGLGDLVGSFVSNPTAPPPVAGPVGIASQIGEIFFAAGPIMTLYVAGILSANLALVNALPFPPLDGGRILVMVLKSFLGRRISLRAERLTYLVGFVFLFAFLIWVTGFDIARLFNGGGS